MNLQCDWSDCTFTDATRKYFMMFYEVWKISSYGMHIFLCNVCNFQYFISGWPTLVLGPSIIQISEITQHVLCGTRNNLASECCYINFTKI